MRSEQSWSMLDPKPVLLYLSNLDEYIVYWNGKVMPHAMALNMALETYGIYATPEMKPLWNKITSASITLMDLKPGRGILKWQNLPCIHILKESCRIT